MDELLQNLSSPAWWVSVVVAGVVVNVVAHYLRQLLDSRLARVSTRWAARRDARQRQRASLLAALKASEHKQLLYATSEVRYWIRGTFFFGWSISLAFATASSQALVLGLPLFGTGAAFSALGAIWAAQEIWRAINVRTVLRQLHPDLD